MEQEEEETQRLSWEDPQGPADSAPSWHRWERTRKGRDPSKVTLLAPGGARINTEQGSMVGSVNLRCMGSKPGVSGQLSGKDIALASLAPLKTSFSPLHRRERARTAILAPAPLPPAPSSLPPPRCLVPEFSSLAWITEQAPHRSQPPLALASVTPTAF